MTRFGTECDRAMTGAIVALALAKAYRRRGSRKAAAVYLLRAGLLRARYQRLMAGVAHA